MKLAEALDELYGGDPDTFIATRKRLAAEARAAKQRDLAREVLALRRPTRSAWLANQLARHDAAALGGLLDLAPALAEAHTSGSPAQLRELVTLRRQAVDGLVRRAIAIAAGQGQQVSEPVRAELQTILEAALTDSDFAHQLRAGALHQAPASAASFPTELFGPLAPVIPIRPQAERLPEVVDEPSDDPEPAEPTEPTPAQQSARRAAERALARAELDVDEAREALVVREQAQRDALGAAQEARQTADLAAAEVAELRAALTQAEQLCQQREAEAATQDEQAEAATRAHREADQALADAEQAVRDAQDLLASLGVNPPTTTLGRS